jgi:hypothetical protein
VVVLIDTSASMQRPGLWNAAVERATTIANSLTPGDHLALFGFDRVTRPLVGFEAWQSSPAPNRPALVEATLRDTRPGWAYTQLANALVLAAESLAERPEDAASLNRRIVLISDLQEGARLDALQAYDWPKGISVQVERLEPDSRTGNASLHLLPDPEPTANPTNTVVRVRVQTTPDSTHDALQVGWSNPGSTTFSHPPEEVRLAAGANRVLTLPVPASSPTSTPSDLITLRGDAEAFDNTVHVIPPRPANRRILYLSDDPADDPRQPLYFLRRAFPASHPASPTLFQRRTTDAPSPEDAKSALLIATTALPEPAVRFLRTTAENGGTILFAPRDASPASSATLGALLGSGTPAALEEVQARNYDMLSELDFRHPLLAAFANPKFSDFTKVRIWRHRRIDTNALAGARIIARLDSGDPAWIEVPAGRGRVFVFASGWHPDDSQLALSTKFVPLLASLLESTTPATGPTSRPWTVGDIVPLTEPATAQTRLRRPDGSDQAIPVGATNLPAAELPGIYTLEGTADPIRFAVNLDPGESRTVPLPLEDLERHGIALGETGTATNPTPERAAELAASEVEGRQKLWRWFLLATVLFVLLESTLAGWITRRSASPSPAAA